MVKYLVLICFGCVLIQSSYSQTRLDSLEQKILMLDSEVESIHLNLEKSKSKFQRGILVATLGYTITIAGGLMLGRENDEMGQVLPVQWVPSCW